MERKENILGTEKIGKLLLTYSIPGIISMLVNSIYNLDVGASRRVYFGKNGQRWYIVGKNSDGTLALMCNPEKPFVKTLF